MARERQKLDKKESRKQTNNETKRERESSGYAKKETGETHTEGKYRTKKRKRQERIGCKKIKTKKIEVSFRE